VSRSRSARGDDEPLRVFLAAGERSGDLHGAGLAKALLRLCPGALLTGVGGDAMSAAGVRLVERYDPLAVVGLLEVVPRLPGILALLSRVRRRLRRDPPDLYVAVDAPDFNFRLMATARRQGVPIVYFIVPQFWAWRRGRLRTLKRLVERALVIFPFEEGLLRDAGIPADFVGHPLAEEIDPPSDRADLRRSLGWDAGRPLVALLPGSRTGEWDRHLPALRETAAWVRSRRGDIQWGLSVAPGLDPAGLAKLEEEGLIPFKGPARDLLAASDAALVASGTATLEAALLETPLVAFYRLSFLTHAAARLFVDVPFFAMVNVLAGEQVVPEFLQKAARGDAMGPALLSLVDGGQEAGAQRKGFRRVRTLLGSPGAYERAAREILSLLDRSGSTRELQRSPRGASR